MSSSESNSNLPANKPVIRIDGAHRLATVKAESAIVPQAAPMAVLASGESAEQLQLHAGQLARHLQDRRHDVDHREAQLNARIAQLESELRLSRLWLREQSQEFTQRETDVRQQLCEHESRASAMAAAELALDESRRQFAAEARTREDLLARRERQVTESQQRLAQEAARLQTAREQLDLARQQLEREQAEQLCQRQVMDLEQLERLHHQQVSEWKRERAELQQQAQQRHQELDAERESLVQRSQRWHEEREQQQQVLERERKQLDQRQVTLERVRSEVLRLHREALEMRLVAEQLWAQLAGRVSPAELTAGVSKLRNQLADEFRFAHQELETQRLSLQELITRLDQKQQELAEQRNELLAWFRRRQTDLAQKAVELSQRNQRLIAERQQFREEKIEQHGQQFQAMNPRNYLTPGSSATAAN